MATSRFAKPKDEGWWIILGDVGTGELMAMKRLGFVGRSASASLEFAAPDREGRHILYFFFVSDSYFGLDQQFRVFIESVVPT